jgi:FKBP-type peptidyl-prolyl cis-trans isomerase
MKRSICAIVVCISLEALAIAQEQIPPAKKSAPAAAPQNQKERAGYAIGADIGRMLKSQSLEEVDLAFLTRGIRDAITGAKPVMTDEECQETLQAFQKEAQGRAAAKNKAEGERFLAANAKKEGVKTTKSGLQYKVLTEGTGPSPKPTDVVRTHYHGTFINGEVFDSSVERKEPAEFPVGNVIPGWTEALQMMKVGSKWQLVVPSDLAYGVRGRPGIPPNATLIFEVELLGIVKPTPQSE